MYQNRFHNTTNETTETVRVRNIISNSQENYILNVFLAQDKGSGFTTSDIVKLIWDLKYEGNLQGKTDWEKGVIASRLSINVKRSMSNLQEAGYLIKTNKKRDGYFGAKVCIYQMSQVALNLWK